MSSKDFHVTVNIVTWNSEKYIRDLLDSLKAQTFQGFRIIIVDNASTDRTLEIAREYETVAIIKNSANAGFSRAHNKGIEMALKFWEGKSLDDRFIIICNPDIILNNDCVETLLKDIWQNKNTAIAGPKLLRFYEEDGRMEKIKTNIIDSLGLKIFKSRLVADNFAGEKDAGQSARQEVFGASGALMCARAKALEGVKWNKEYFDEDFFAYKEDIDLCWRLRNLGWSIAVNPLAIAYHHRRAGANANSSFLQRISEEKRKPKIIRFLSIRNHLWLIAKNDFLANYLLHMPFIFWGECVKFLYCLLFDFGALRAYFSALRKLPRMLKKRKYLKKAKAGPADIRKWMK